MTASNQDMCEYSVNDYADLPLIVVIKLLKENIHFERNRNKLKE